MIIRGDALMDFLLLFINSLFFNSVTWKSSNVVSYVSHWYYIRTQLKQDFIISGTLRKGVVFVFKNVGQDMLTLISVTYPYSGCKIQYFIAISFQQS